MNTKAEEAAGQADTRQAPSALGVGSRENARVRLFSTAARLRQYAEDLEALARNIPEEMNPQAERILWDMVTQWKPR